MLDIQPPPSRTRHGNGLPGPGQLPGPNPLPAPDLLDVIDRLAAAASQTRLAQELLAYLAEQGCTCFMIARLPADRHMPPTPLLVAGHNASAWLERYRAERLHLHDPVMDRARATPQPFHWAALRGALERDRAGWRTLESFRDFGKSDGVCVPIPGPAGFQGVMSAAGLALDDSPCTLAGIQIIAPFAYAAAERLSRGGRRPARLSDREREVMRGIAGGESQSGIARRLAISERTVEEHMRNARRKLGAGNTPHAVAVALTSGEIHMDTGWPG